MESITELRKKKKLFYSNYCNDKFEGKSNGLWTYYVCKCGKKTMPINGKGKMLDLHGEIKSITKI
ncbi:MAG TPA: hypothetical protein VN026_11540 [Bacteroidia bacterium]|jgi:hypothetical protein|nr:hypothetical protein [Bacteroidia bacterium]